ncbi:unnamed protein product, partial [Callosobruchus maculatus]
MPRFKKCFSLFSRCFHFAFLLYEKAWVGAMRAKSLFTTQALKETCTKISSRCGKNSSASQVFETEEAD